MKRILLMILVSVFALGLTACAGGEGQPSSPSNVDQASIDTDKPSTSPETSMTTTGKILKDEIWRGDLLMTGDVEIPTGVTVTIEPGTVIQFTAERDDQHDPSEYSPADPETLPNTIISIIVFGTLEAQGTPDQPIVFTSEQDVGDINWQSIILEDGGTALLNHVVIEQGYFGVQVDAPTANLTVINTTFRDITTCCICVGGFPLDGTIHITDNHFNKCGREAIDTYHPHDFEVRHNVFSGNYVGIMSVGSKITIENNLFINNSRGIGVIEGGTPLIIGNEFTKNDGGAISIAGASPTIIHNNIHDNLVNIQIEEFDQDVKAEENWWGSTDIDVIAASIRDGKDDPSLGIVDFEPFAVEAFDLDIPRYE